MATFTAQLGDVSNQIQPHTMPVESSGIGAVAQAASAFLVPMVKEKRESDQNETLDRMSAELDKEFETLAEARRQGKISSSQLRSRVSVRSKQLGADNPELAAKWRDRVKQDYGGNLRQQYVEEEMNSFAVEDKAREDMYSWAVKNDFVSKDSSGQVDREKTIEDVADFNNLKIEMELLKNKKGPEAVPLFNQKLHQVYNKGERMLTNRLLQIEKNESLTPTDKRMQYKEQISKFKSEFNAQYLNPGLASFPMKREDSTGLTSYWDSKWTNLENSLLASSSMQKRADLIDTAAEIGAQDFYTDNPSIKAMEKILPSEVHSTVMTNMLKYQKAKLGSMSVQDKLSYDVKRSVDQGTFTKSMSDYYTGKTASFSEVPEESKKDVLGTSLMLDDDYTARRELATEDLKPAAKALNTVTEAALFSNAKVDKEKALKRLNNNTKFDNLRKGVANGDMSNASQALLNAEELSREYLVREQANMMDSLLSVGAGHAVAVPMYNSRTGMLEPMVNADAVRQAVRAQTKGLNLSPEVLADHEYSLTLRATQAANKSIKPFNDAIGVYSKAFVSRSGNKYSENDIKYNIAEKLGYKTSKMPSIKYDIDSTELGLTAEEKTVGTQGESLPTETTPVQDLAPVVRELKDKGVDAGKIKESIKKYYDSLDGELADPTVLAEILNKLG